jgi:hypothetical protein
MKKSRCRSMVTGLALRQEAVDYLGKFLLSSREEISQPGIELPTSFLRFEYFLIIIR